MILDSTSSSSGSPYELLLPVALILFLSKAISVLFKKMRMPQVIGFLVAGLIIGLVTFIPGQTILNDYTKGGIEILAKFGVVMILFSAGVETDTKAIKSVGGAAVVITSLGVIVPLALGFLVSYLFRVYGGVTDPSLEAGINPIYSDIYYGVILTATSVSITVATLKELGKLDSKVGNAIVSAAIIDDVIGIILLSLVISLSGSSSGGSDFNLLEWFIGICGGQVEGALTTLVIIANMAIFFLLSWGVGFFIRKFFNHLGKKYPHHIRIPIYSLAFCFLWAYVAQAFFQIADITGAYIAGLILSVTSPKEYIDHRAETTNNVFFVPIFFASVALKMYTANFDFSNVMFILFGLTWILVGALGKVIGAGLGAKMCKFSWRDSAIVGVGMMARAEVLIVTAQTGVDAGLVSDKIIPFTLILILLTSFVTPIFLKILYKNDLPTRLPGSEERDLPDEEEAPVEAKSDSSASLTPESK